RGDRLPQEVEGPGEARGGHHQQQDREVGVEHLHPLRAAREGAVDAAAGEHRQQRQRRRVEGDEQRHEQHLAQVRAEVADDAPEELRVGVVAVVLFAGQAAQDEAHQSYLWKMRWYSSLRSRSSACVPWSTRRERSSMMMRSARRICDSRWVITSEVRPLSTALMAVWISSSVAES